MKLKEKLSKEFAEDSGDSTDASTYLAGFEKAREMAIDLQYIHCCECKLGIDTMGEEEVEE